MRGRLVYCRYLSILLIVFFISSCDWFTVQDLNEVFMAQLNELIEIIDEEGNSISLDSINIMPPYIYRGSTESDDIAPKDRKDSLYYLKTRDGELIGKWEIEELINYYEKNNRYEYLLSNGKYIFFETDKNLIHTVSEQVQSPSELNASLVRGRYKNVAEKPDGW